MRTKRALFCASMLGGLVAAASAGASPVLPTGGVVKAGSATIGAPAAGSLVVSQTSSKAIIDWSSFSIGQGGAVQFDNGSGATLNRVTGSNISSIDGLLSATGSIYLINPNGVIVGKTGVVNTGGTFVASTLDVANSSFLAGGPLTFSGPSAASVVNLGKVSSLGGNVAMIAATVENDGSIAASKGDVGLIAGTTVTMDDTDNDAGGLFSVQVGDGSTSATNTGAIAAAAVELRAQQGNVYALAGNTGGVINATGLDTSGGVIKLISEGGTTTVTGTLSAEGPNGTGGQIETSGETLDLGAATVNTHRGSWLLDPTNLIIDSVAASAIDTALASGNVTLATSASGAPTETGVTGATGNTASGAGDILVASPITWSTGSTLTLNAYAALIIDAPITVTGAGQVVLDFSTSAADAPGGLSFDLGPSGFAGSLSFAAGQSGQALTINDTSYTLEYSPAALITAMNATPTGNFALAESGPGGASWIEAPVNSFFYGTLEGLGNTITGLTINGVGASLAALIGVNYGTVRDLGVVGGTVFGDYYVGGLVGADYGTVEASYATVDVLGSGSVGGLVGRVVAGGTVQTSYATGAVTGYVAVGGLVGSNSGTVERSYATGEVTGSDYVGGKVTGSNYVGGLVGDNYAATVETSFATGPVAGGSYVGGLVGRSRYSAVETSYATGNVSAGSQNAGGLVGYNYASNVETSYATGAVSGSSYVGGLVGRSGGYERARIETSYATGEVSGSGDAGGLVGSDEIFGQFGTVSDSYWDTSTTGRSGTESGATGLTTAQLQSNSTGDMAKLNFGGTAFGGGTAGLYPYLLTFFPNGVQAITGTATAGGSAAAAAQVGIYYGGTQLGGGTASSGANGYFYLAVAAGTLSAGGDKIGADITLSGDSSPTGLVYTDAGSVVSNVLTLPNVVAAQSTQSTSELTYSVLQTDLAATFGASTYMGLETSLASTPLTIDASGASFTADQAIAWTSSGLLDLDANGALIIAAPISVTGAGQVTLTYGAGGLSFDLGPSGFAGSLSYAVGSGEGDAGQALSINGTSYTLLYSMSDVTAMTAIGDYALAAPVTATGNTYTGALLGYFSGALEGLGNSITGLTIDSAGNRVGLIGKLNSGGMVRDLGLADGSVTGLDDVGGLAGLNDGVIIDVSATGNVSAPGGSYVGGLVGDNASGGAITGATTSGATVSGDGGFAVGGLVGYNSATVTGASAADTVENGASGGYIGGLVGYSAAGASISSSSASGNVTGGAKYTGGLVGYNDGAIDGGVPSSASGNVSAAGGSHVGGLVGYNAAAGTITGATASGTVTGLDYVGGLAGANDNTISDVSASGNVSAAGGDYIGGLVGQNTAAGTINAAFASGTSVSAAGGVAGGGLVGLNSGAISDTYADVGAVAGGTYLGGLVGDNSGGVATSWSSGAVSGIRDLGGSIGKDAGGTITSVYWDEGTSGLTDGTGAGPSTGLTGIGGATGISSDAQTTYAGFNFSTIWTINPGTSRAFLQSSTPATPPT